MQWGSERVGIGSIHSSGLVPRLRFRLTLGLGLSSKLGGDVGLRPRTRFAGVQPGRFFYTPKMSSLPHDAV